jgi:hypothetical protein
VSAHGYLAHWSADRIYYGTDVRMGEIALGALLAVVVERVQLLKQPGRGLVRTVAALQLPALAIAVWAITSASQSSAWLYQGGLLAMALVWVVLVLGAVLEVGPIAALAGFRPLVWLGVVSYGVYLVHWPLLLVLHPFHAPLADASIALTVTLVVAGLSARFFEGPIRANHIRVPTRRALMFSGATVVAMVIGVVSLPTWTRVVSPNAAAASAPASEASLLGSPPRRTVRVLVIGDSTASLLGSELSKWSGKRVRLAVVNRAVAGCQLANADAQNMTDPAVWSKQGSECQHWAVRVASEVSFDPDVVFFVFGPTEAAELRLVRGASASDISHPDVQTETRAEVSALRREFPRALFVWATAATPFTSTTATPESHWLINDPGRIAIWNQMVSEFAAAPRSARFDLAALIGAAPGGLRDRTWRPDGMHLDGAPLDIVATATAARLTALTS